MNITQRKLKFVIKDFIDCFNYFVSCKYSTRFLIIQEKFKILAEFDLLLSLLSGDSSYRLIIEEQRRQFIANVDVLLSGFPKPGEPEPIQQLPSIVEPEQIQQLALVLYEAQPPEILHKIPTQEEQQVLPEHQALEKQKLLSLICRYFCIRVNLLDGQSYFLVISSSSYSCALEFALSNSLNPVSSFDFVWESETSLNQQLALSHAET